MNDTRKTITALLLIAVIFFCAITITNNVGRFLRVDLTKNKLYTLSAGTKTVIEEIHQPLELKLFYARTAAMRGPEALRAYNNYYLYVRDLLREYESLSRGNLRLTIIDPRPHSDEEIEAIQYGLKRFSAGEESFFFGLAVVSEFGRQAAVPFFAPHRQPLVEYDISSAIYNAATIKKKTIGIMSPLSVLGAGLSPYMMEMMRMQGREVPEEWHMIKQLKQFYELQKIGPDSIEIDPVDVLMVIHPKDLPRHLHFAIDQHVMKGGKLIVFVDPYCVVDPAKEHQNKSSNLNRLLEGWGCSLIPDSVAGDRSLGVSVQIMPNQPAQRLPTYMDLRGESFNRDDVITAQLDGVRLLFAGALIPTDVPGVRFETLLATTSTGSFVKASPGDIMAFSDPDMVTAGLGDGTEPVVLGCRLTGRFKSAFPDGITIVDEEEGTRRYYEALKESAGETTIVVYSDVDMINDFIAFQETFFGISAQGDNMALLLNTVENLGGAGALSAARAKGRFSRPFDVFNTIEEEAERATASKVDAVKADIARYQQELQSIGAQVGGEAESIIQSELIERKRHLEERLLMAQRELRELNRDKRIQIESLIGRIKLYNTVTAPSIILLIAVIVFFARVYKKKKYLGVRHEK